MRLPRFGIRAMNSSRVAVFRLSLAAAAPWPDGGAPADWLVAVAFALAALALAAFVLAVFDAPAFVVFAFPPPGAQAAEASSGRSSTDVKIAKRMIDGLGVIGLPFGCGNFSGFSMLEPHYTRGPPVE